MAKKDNKLFYTIIFLALALLVMFYLNQEKEPGALTPFAVGSETCEFVWGSTASGIYNCMVPDGCFAWIAPIFCDEEVNTQIVELRTNADFASDYDNAGTWIAINGVPSGTTLIKTDTLGGYCRTSTTGGSNNPINRETPHGNEIHFWQKNLNFFHDCIFYANEA